MAKPGLTNPLGLNRPPTRVGPVKNPYLKAKPVGPMGPMGASGPYKAPVTGPSLASFAAPANDTPDYEKRFQAALDQTQQGIASQYGSALADINAREGLANQAVALLPGQVTDIYGKGAASLAQQTGALDAAQKASGLTSYMGAGAEMAPLQAAIGQDQSARMADVPLLQLGTAAQFQGQRGALQQAKAESNTSLLAEAANAAAERQFQMEQAKQANQWTIDAEQRRNAAEDSRMIRTYELEQGAAAAEAKAAKDEEARTILNQYAPTDASKERGAALANYVSKRPSKALDAGNYGAYNNALKLMRSGKKSKNMLAVRAAAGMKGTPFSGAAKYVENIGGTNWSKPENVAKALEAAGFNSAAALFRYKYSKGGPNTTTAAPAKE